RRSLRSSPSCCPTMLPTSRAPRSTSTAAFSCGERPHALIASAIQSPPPFRHERGHGDEHRDRPRDRGEVGRNLRARRGRLEGRALGDLLHVHVSSYLSPEGPLPPLL